MAIKVNYGHHEFWLSEEYDAEDVVHDLTAASKAELFTDLKTSDGGTVHLLGSPGVPIVITELGAAGRGGALPLSVSDTLG
ncbi:hypothetical protein [Paenarthrobacter nitroguajacolicus]|uniref:hypothetical protein n=1 Tax=Paenarthrobacter nitroguajacolicus TaxID=211146 RepID=UPI0015B7BD0C|nr:hypothetical protein [Paenarthrobacter nitroguajacolicus]